MNTRATAFGVLRVLAALSCLAAASCGSGEHSPTRGRMEMRGGPPGAPMGLRRGFDTNASYIRATELKAAGNCAEAIPLLRRIAMLGPGYENAQTALGECLVETPESQEGATWLRRAADAGWPEAQAALAQYHGSGPAAARDTAEAAYWLALYDANPGKARVGFRPVDPKRMDALRAALSPEERAIGARRALSWRRQLWLPPASSEEARPQGERGSPEPRPPRAPR